MQTTVRTTVRMRKDLFDQSRLLALKKGVSFQEVLNNTLALGLGKITDLESNKEAMTKIDKFRLSLSATHVDLENLLESSETDLK